jgi:hypothetical protein
MKLHLHSPYAFMDWCLIKYREHFTLFALRTGSRHSSIGIATSYGLDGWGLIPGRGKKFLIIPQRAERL